ncbi:helix-turn-helix transcriptional regulator [Ralstonia sp. 25C]|uniref:helix-turn-helix transcriptional regulator n=1 Tax=Ralstonia sp. 25C TaxID=3447363 RepID=UPI003F750B08
MSNQPYEAAQRHPSHKHSPAPGNACQSARQPDKASRILRVKQLVERVSLSRATVYVLMATDPTFPRKVKLTARSIGFLESDVDAWIASRAQLCASA